MTKAQRLALVRGVHTAIYLVMALATVVIIYAGLTGAYGPWLWTAAGLIGAESAAGPPPHGLGGVECGTVARSRATWDA
jgi:hypothetical protein